MNRDPGFFRALTDEQILVAASLWLEGRNTERLAVYFGRHESVIYNSLTRIVDASRTSYREAAE